MTREAESGRQRGFLLSGEGPYQKARLEISGALANLKRLADTGDLDARDVERLTRLTGARLAVLERETESRQKQGASAAGEFIQAVRTSS